MGVLRPVVGVPRATVRDFSAAVGVHRLTVDAHGAPWASSVPPLVSSVSPLDSPVPPLVSTERRGRPPSQRWSPPFRRWCPRSAVDVLRATVGVLRPIVGVHGGVGNAVFRPICDLEVSTQRDSGRGLHPVSFRSGHRLPLSLSQGLQVSNPVAPQLDHIIANLELMPLRMNIGKRDRTGDRQISLAERLRGAGLF